MVPGTAWLTGANEPGRHAVNVVAGRDFTPGRHDRGGRGAGRRPLPGRAGAATLTIRRGIEVGHIFQLGRRFADAFEAGRAGPGRQAGPDHHGLVRRRRVPAGGGDRRAAPRRARPGLAGRGRAGDVHIVAAGKGDAGRGGGRLGGQLAGRGLRVLVDDRAGVSVGVKFTDAELIGVPRAVVVGRRLADGYVELRDRATGERSEVAVAELVDRLVD